MNYKALPVTLKVARLIAMVMSEFSVSRGNRGPRYWGPTRLPAYHGINMVGAGHFHRYLALAPGAAAVVAAVNQTVPGAAVDAGRSSRINGDLEHAAWGDLAQVHPLPGLAAVLGADQHSGLLGSRRSASSAGAGGQIHYLGVVGRNDHPAAV